MGFMIFKMLSRVELEPHGIRDDEPTDYFNKFDNLQSTEDAYI